MRKSMLTTAITTALLGSLAFGVQASEQEPQGMYSADDILDADVYFANGSGDEIGEVDDILFDEDMRISALVIESGAVLGLGGREIVVGTDYFSLETHTESDGDIEHRIILDASSDEIAAFPTYDRDWWEQTKVNARSAWETTRDGAESAWQRTRNAVANDE
ncbi:PRC-barrel domain-containing protein [Vreelandella populi]|uniref:PRC-barrel domain containing protein n=1 Tax=Vreelandella populi TaxID=2498858 RepID=A0A433LCE2_9GAMM|nr:PRC-barrel domain-containing protein [Halomonas populi]RUR39232.1 PRC-barrel domain containing protein [Halomonas populi]RUR46344.1 PRC-barrel domain containing protein [Halomonas populi]RUR53150.1 PRC-barrel domain containing protein [Halomonas populi]